MSAEHSDMTNQSDPQYTHDDIDALRAQIDELDRIIIDAVKKRSEVSRTIGKIRMAHGGTRLVHSREIQVLERFQEIGPEGYNLAMMLLRLGRGVLGKEPEEPGN